MSEIKHGTHQTYIEKKCRCEVCVKANTERAMRGRRARIEQRKLGLANFKHGRSGYTNYGCRCETCVEDKAKYMAGFRSSKKKDTPEAPST